MPSGSAQHHAVKTLRGTHRLASIRQTAVENKGAIRKIAFELGDHVVAQWGNLAVVLRGQALEHGIAGVRNEHPAARVINLAYEITDEIVGFFVIQAQTVLHSDRNVDRVLHRFHAIRHQGRLRHQAGAKRALLHALRRTAAIQVDLVVAPLPAQPGGLGQGFRLAAAKLQRHGVLGLVKVQVTRDIAMQQRARGDHFRVQACARGQQPVKIAAMAVGNVNHRGDA
ncbi:hypothetical protein D3C87_1418260 [compost metagenome]